MEFRVKTGVSSKSKSKHLVSAGRKYLGHSLQRSTIVAVSCGDFMIPNAVHWGLYLDRIDLAHCVTRSYHKPA